MRQAKAASRAVSHAAVDCAGHGALQHDVKTPAQKAIRAGVRRSEKAFSAMR
jgi:hypothetical protein